MQQFPVEPIPQVSARYVLAFPSRERGVVDLERHRNGRFIDDERRPRLDRVGVAQGIRDVQLIEAREGDDLAGVGFVPLDLFETLKRKDLQNPSVSRAAVGADHRHGGVPLDPAALYAANSDHADVARVIERAHLKLEGPVGIDLRCGHMFDDRFKEHGHIVAAHRWLQGGPAFESRGVDYRKIQLCVRCAETVEQVEGLIHRPAGPGRGAVDFVDDKDGAEPLGQRLARDEPGLRHWALDGVHQQKHRIDHG